MTYLVVYPYKDYTRVRICAKGVEVPAISKIWTITTPAEHKVFYKNVLKALNPFYVGGMMAEKGSLYSIPMDQCKAIIESELGLDDIAHNASLNAHVSTQTYINMGKVGWTLGVTAFKLVRLLMVFTMFFLSIPLLLGSGRRR